ncbi:MAG: phosphoribosylformylglycinamidine synthase II, partial [Alphaproteobacteria bacterium]|nr:phosphoribosylformylglycinamidine synthase II [Alphaproteobacteria bacterium]
ILPTPTIGAVGVIDDITKGVGSRLVQAGLALVLIGDTKGWLGQSLYLREACGREEGAPPPVDLAVERRNGDFVREQINLRRASACHDLSDGGLLVGLAEMCIAGGMGVEVELPASSMPSHAFLYGEDQGRYLIATGKADKILTAAKAAGVPAVQLGYAGGASLTVKGVLSVKLADIKTAHEAWLPAYMSGSE